MSREVAMPRRTVPRPVLAVAVAVAVAALLLVGCDSVAEFEIENGTDSVLRVDVFALKEGGADTVAESLRPGGVVSYGDIYGVGCCFGSDPPPRYTIAAKNPSGDVVYRRTFAYNEGDRGCRVVIEAGGCQSDADVPAVCEGGHAGFSRHLGIKNERAGAVRILLEGDRGEIAPGEVRGVAVWEDDPPRTLRIVDATTGKPIIEGPIHWDDFGIPVHWDDVVTPAVGAPPDIVIR
jgi:hypothetical protein